MKRITYLLMIVLSLILGINRVCASSYNGKLYEVWDTESGVNVYAVESNGYMDYNSWMIKSTIDNKIYYCIDPATPLEGASVNSHTVYSNKADIIAHTPLTESTYKKVQLLAYYGYGYKDDYYDHTSEKWYGITQVMIWRVMRPDLTWTFKKTRDGTASNNNFKKEVAEMNKLVNSYDTDPSFHTKTYRLLTGTSISVEDTNKVLYQYRQDGTNRKVNITQNGNKLTISSNAEPSTHNIGFKFKSYTNDYFGAFVSSQWQDIIRVGQPDEKWAQINIQVYGGQVNIQKLDEDKEKSVPQGDATFEDAVYEVFKGNVSVGTIITDSSGKGTLSLDYGTYTLKEETPPRGYKLSDKEYTFTISSSNYNVNVLVMDEVIKGRLKLVKTKGGSGEEFTVEEGAKFEVIDKDSNVVYELETNEKGMAIEKLAFGKYTIHQTKSAEGYLPVEDFEIEIYEDKIYEVDLQNLKLSKLEFTKTDYSTGKVVPNALIEVYKDNDSLVGNCKTDSKGKCVFPNLEIGNYYILEKDAPKYYKLNKEKMPFEVKENGKIIKCTMENHRKEGSLKIIKKDKKTNKLLKGAEFDIYLTDINKLLFKGTTNEKGEIIINNIIAGKYCIIETKAPEGYKLDKNKHCISIEEDNQSVEVIIKDNKNIIVVPKTSAFNIIGIVATILILSGSGYFIYEKFY